MATLCIRDACHEVATGIELDRFVAASRSASSQLDRFVGRHDREIWVGCVVRELGRVVVIGSSAHG